MGTGLAVGPFNQIVDSAPKECPKVLINLENTDFSGYDFKTKYKPERLFLQGKCDDVVTKISKDCGWGEDFSKRIANSKNQPDPTKMDELLAKMEQFEIHVKEEEKPPTGATVEEVKEEESTGATVEEVPEDAAPVGDGGEKKQEEKKVEE